MTVKEKFLSIKTYKDFDMRRNEFKNLDVRDPEVRQHFYVIFPTLDNSAYENGIIEDVFKKK